MQATENKLAQRSARDAAVIRDATLAAEEQQQYLTFQLGDEMFAIGILSIKEILEYNSLTIDFDTNGKVKAMKQRTKDDMKNVDLVSRETPTAGREYSVLEQLISNVGKFGKDKTAASK